MCMVFSTAYNPAVYPTSDLIMKWLAVLYSS